MPDDKETGITRDEVNIILLVDNSYSMRGQKIEQVNNAIPALRNGLAEFADENNIDVKFRVIAFSDAIDWKVGSVESGVKPEDVIWEELQVDNRTNTALAINAACDCLKTKNLGVPSGGQALRPIVILITDGLTTSPADEYLAAIEKLKLKLSGKSGKEKVTRVALGVGDFNASELIQFASVGTVDNEDNKPFAFSISDASDLAETIVSLAVTSLFSSITEQGDDEPIKMETITWV